MHAPLVIVRHRPFAPILCTHPSVSGALLHCLQPGSRHMVGWQLLTAGFALDACLHWYRRMCTTTTHSSSRSRLS